MKSSIFPVVMVRGKSGGKQNPWALTEKSQDDRELNQTEGEESLAQQEPKAEGLDLTGGSRKRD
jgi:hypothetical protein